MNILSILFIVVMVAMVGFAWARLRSNWRDVQSMRGNSNAAPDLAGTDFVEGPDCAHHHGHGHDAAHHGGDAGGHDFGGFHGGDHGGFDGGGGHH
jgi:hypothetical protein